MFWKKLAHFILRYRIPILIILAILTAVMGYFAMQVKMRYDMASAIPEDNPEFIKYEKFLKTFGQDGNMMVVGFDKDNVFEPTFFKSFSEWQEKIKSSDGVLSVLAIPSAIQIKKNETDSSSKLITELIFNKKNNFDSAVLNFKNLPFYSGILYNLKSNSYLSAIYLDGVKIRTKERVKIMKNIKTITDAFAKQNNLEIHYSGLPYIRTEFAESLRMEMNLILIASLVLTSLILILFFRSFTAMLFSMIVVFSGVIWAVGLIELAGYRITILTALIAPLIVVIGIPNCIYFLNKYHTQYALSNNKQESLIAMVERMGIVTLFTNLTAAIGFGVFYFTKSQVLKEFGFVAGISILVVFALSIFSIPAIFSFLPPPKTRHTKYLENKYLTSVLLKFEYWVTYHRKFVYVFTIITVIISIIGISKLYSEGHLVDDLPKENALYKDLKYFEKNFHGVMPLEIMIDTKKKNGASSLAAIQKVNEFTEELRGFSEFSKPLSFVEAIKFARQAFYDGDSTSYDVPNSFDISFLLPYLKRKSETGKSQFSQLATSFLDSNKQIIRISVGIEDVGSVKLPVLLDSVNKIATSIFDTSKYEITYTGTSVVFLEGSKFIINSLRDSLLLALLMIVVCMAVLFKSWRIVVISIIVNIIPLLITAGIMGFANIPLKPSTVLVFSIALGIAIDVTIRFLVNYKQDLSLYNYDIHKTVQNTIQETGISIIYTSLILSAGFIVFLVSQFDGTKALGYLTALTLILAMLTNLTLLPALLVWFDRQKKTNN